MWSYSVLPASLQPTVAPPPEIPDLSHWHQAWSQPFPALRGAQAAQQDEFAPDVVSFIQLPDGVTLGGETRQWHAIEVNLEGPSASETAATFRDNRFDVTFTQAGQDPVVVPGYFAADGDAANTSATSGNIWRCIFVPPTIGRWDFTIAFHTDTDIAASAPGVGGTPLAPYHGKNGWINVAASDKLPPDMRAPNLGRLTGRPSGGLGLEFLMSYTGDPAHFELWCGPGGPENFLGCSDFDATAQLGSFPLYTWSAHVGDWRTGDPQWQSTKGRGVIGSINYLADHGVNTLYLVLDSIDGGDARSVYPWITPPAHDSGARDVYSCAKLDQWNIVLSHANQRGVIPMILFRENENWGSLGFSAFPSSGGDEFSLGVLEKVYMREIAARFGHLLAIIWCICEETGGTDFTMSGKDQDYLIAQADWLHGVDGYGNLTVTHNISTQEAETYGFSAIRARSTYDGIAYINGSGSLTPQQVLETYRTQSEGDGRKWVIWNAETFNNPLLPDSQDSSHINLRTLDIWPTLIGGGAGCTPLFGASGEDVTTETFATRNNGWLQLNLARQIMKFYLPDLAAGIPNNALVSGVSGALCLSNPGEWYVVYLPAGGTPSLNLTGETGTWRRRWFNPRAVADASAELGISGGGTVSLGASPTSGAGNDWVAIVSKPSSAPSIRGLMLWDVANNVPLGFMYEGMVLDLSASPAPPAQLAWLAVCDPGIVGSVQFADFDGLGVQTEGTPPYFGPSGDVSAVPVGWVVSAGSWQIMVTAYDGPNATGNAGTPFVLNFSVVGVFSETLTTRAGLALTTRAGEPLTTRGGA